MSPSGRCLATFLDIPLLVGVEQSRWQRLASHSGDGFVALCCGTGFGYKGRYKTRPVLAFPSIDARDP